MFNMEPYTYCTTLLETRHYNIYHKWYCVKFYYNDDIFHIMGTRLHEELVNFKHIFIYFVSHNKYNQIENCSKTITRGEAQ